MQALIIFCTLAALVGLPIGYGLAWLLEEFLAYLDRTFDVYFGDQAQVLVWTWEMRP